ncbi:MAG: CASC3 protein CASC3 [Slackia sp.]|nr:CASC3 protein CASC3 [Slackia sp.]
MAQQKMTAKQRAAHVEAAKRREEAEAKRRARQARNKKIFTIAVCVILVLALGIPTVAIMAMGGAGVA